MSCLKRFQNHLAGLSLLLAVTAHASDFGDPIAGFAIDLPEGYAERSRQQPPGATILTFEHGDQSPIVVSALSFDSGYEGNEEIFASMLETVEEVFGGATEARELKDLEIGGLPARWGWMGRREANGDGMIAGLGVIELDDRFVGLSVSMPDTKFAAFRPAIEAAFFSIRSYGDQPGEVTRVVDVEHRPSEPILLAPSTYEHPLFTVDLPAGWEGKTVATEAKQINLASISDGGNTITVMCMSGMLASRKVIEDVMQTTMSSNMPNIAVRGKDKSRAANGKQAYFTLYEGRTESRGTTVELHGVTAAVKNGKCQLGFIAVGPATADARGVDEVMGIVRSVR
ncbi:MAG: hypothetical protein AAGE85_12595 [Pseudomonadota bacterium]